MFQDQLTQAQRIRLEAYAQAVATSAHRVARGAAAMDVDALVETSKTIERFIVGGSPAAAEET